MQTFRFLSYTKTKTEYTCKIDSPDFTVDKSVIAPSGTYIILFYIYYYLILLLLLK